MNEEEIQKAAKNLATIYEKLGDKAFFLNLTGDALSYTATKIASLKGRLVEVKRMAEQDYRDADKEYKRTKAVAFKRLTSGEGKVSATAAEKLLYAEEDVLAASQRNNESEALWNFVKSLAADGHDMVEAIRSRLIDLQGSRKDERIG